MNLSKVFLSHDLQFVLDDEIVVRMMVVVDSLFLGNRVCWRFPAKIFVALRLVVHWLPHIHRQSTAVAEMLPMMSFDLLENSVEDLKVVVVVAAIAVFVAATFVALLAAVAVVLELRLLSMLIAFAVQKKRRKKKR